MAKPENMNWPEVLEDYKLGIIDPAVWALDLANGEWVFVGTDEDLADKHGLEYREICPAGDPDYEDWRWWYEREAISMMANKYGEPKHDDLSEVLIALGIRLV